MRGCSRALDAAEAADHHDGKAQNNDIRTETRLHRDLGRGQRAGQTGEQHAEGEGDRINPVHPHAHADAHFLVVDHGQHDLAGDRAIEAEPHRETDGGGNRNQHQIVADVIETRESDIAEQLIGLRGVDRVHAPDQLGNVLENKEHRVRHQQQYDFVAAIEHFQQAAFEQKADCGRDQRHRNQHGDKTDARRQAVRRNRGHCGRGDIGAERVETAMRDIENFENAEYQRQSQCHNEQPGSLNQPVENDRQKEVHETVFMLIIAGKGEI